jgi:D-alanyl-D-alanine carboxypeptidase/D-alanyl-D-alanine-endopeptidase (penicillin-binding protein 4)
MLTLKSCLAVLACFMALPAFAAPMNTAPMNTIPESVERVLSAYQMPAKSLSLFVQDVNQDTPLLAVNSDVARNPASTIKLLMTSIALDELGPTYQWKTEGYLGGDLTDGLLDGDLYMKGYGDPFMVVERYWLLLKRIQQHGLAEIGGDLVIDNSYFEIEKADPADFDGQPYRSYNVVPDAFLVNFQAIDFIFRPNQAGDGVDIVANPMPANLEIENRLRLTGGLCGGFQNGISVSIADAFMQNQVTFSGGFRGGCREYHLSRAVLQAPTYAYGMFETLWKDMGGELRGGLRVESVPESLEPFVVVESPPLSEIIRSINKWSNNVMARHLLLTLGAERFGPPATVEKGRQAAAMILDEKGLDFPELRIDNGAGLSRKTRISAASLGRVLLAADEGIYNAEFISSLALAGLDGTLRRRFRDEGLTGRMHLKTGRLTGVFAMAGYLRAESGRRFVVVAIQNHADAHRGPGEEAQSEFLRWVYQQ